MSINTLLSNETILDDLTAIIDVKSGNIKNVLGVAPIAVSTTNGNASVSLTLGPYFTVGPTDDLSLDFTNTGAPNGYILSKASSNTMTWVPDSVGPVLTSTLPILKTGNNFSLNEGAFLTTFLGNLTLNTAAPTASGQALSSTATPGLLQFITPSSYTGTAPIVLTGSAFSLNEGAYMTTVANQLTLRLLAPPAVGQVLSYQGVANELAFITPTAANIYGTATLIGGIANIAITGITLTSVCLVSYKKFIFVPGLGSLSGECVVAGTLAIVSSNLADVSEIFYMVKL